jgi:hypothetical protein
VLEAVRVDLLLECLDDEVAGVRLDPFGVRLVLGARKGRQKADELDSPLLEAFGAECYGPDQRLLYAPELD